MRAVETDLPEVLVLEPEVLGDERGYFKESWNATTFAGLVGHDVAFVQDNSSRSRGGVVRGIHFQNPNPQAKLVRCSAGAIFDVAVDLQQSSPRFGQWVGVELSAENHRQLWIPEGFGHGFAVLGEGADIEYKVAGYYSQSDDRAVAWDDPSIGVDWPLDGPPVLSKKDQKAPKLGEADTYV
ncbi:MAG TPA: dTDP-4-dehydrorhamnose 3,5-epimerase [Actinobacteria bacterium]|nr:dTDP-4-dehydrorhamnose 3,5-epimerase [Actinomycetota bacterium]